MVGNGLILFSWKDFASDEVTTKIFNFSGRYLGIVLQPKIASQPGERAENLVPVTKSYDSQHFLLVRQNNARHQGCITKLSKSATG